MRNTFKIIESTSYSMIRAQRANAIGLHGFSAAGGSEDILKAVAGDDEHARKQPPAAARARRFAAKSAPAEQRQIRTIPVNSVRAGQ